MHDVIPGRYLSVGRVVQVVGLASGFVPSATVTAVTPRYNDLGGRWSTVTLQLPDEQLLPDLDTRALVFMTPEWTELGWCTECRHQREVEERSDESAYEGNHEIGFKVTRYECGHTVETRVGVIGSSPGWESAAEAQADHRLRERQARHTASMDAHGY